MAFTIQKTSLDFLLTGAREYPERKVLTAGKRNCSYGELFDLISRKAGYLEENGVAPGSRVAVYSDNDFQMFLSLFAAWALNAVCIPMNMSQKEEKTRAIEEIIKPDIGFYHESDESTTMKAFPVHPLEGMGEPAAIKNENKPDDTAVIMFTSGTSGVPKAVPMTHFSIAYNTILTAERIGINRDDDLFVNTPAYTTTTIIHLLTMMSAGASMTIDRGFLFGTGILDTIVKHGCTGFGGVPVHFLRLSDAVAEKSPPSSLRFIFNSGDHLPVSLIKQIRELMPKLKIFCAYGLTEVSGRLCILPGDMIDEKTGSVGYPLEGMSVTVRDEHGNIREPNETGEVYVSGPALMEGYVNNPEINKAVMTEYGFATGDFGYLDNDGCLFLQGRNDDILKVGGEKVSVKMIEEALYDFESLKDFMVVKYYDDHLGMIPFLYYVIKDEVDFKRQDLVKYLKSRLPHTHVPARMEEVLEIPRTSSGKAIRKTQ